MVAPVPYDSTQLRRLQPDGAMLLGGPNLRVRVAVLKLGVILATACGEVVAPEDASVEAAVLAELERELERAGSLMLFVDVRESPRMPAASREKIAEWMRRHRARLLPSHVLVRSQLIEMALSIITMLVGGGMFKIYTKAPTFLELVRSAVPGFTDLPTVPQS